MDVQSIIDKASTAEASTTNVSATFIGQKQTVESIVEIVDLCWLEQLLLGKVTFNGPNTFSSAMLSVSGNTTSRRDSDVRRGRVNELLE